MARHINGKMMIWDAISNGVIWWEPSHWQFSHFCFVPFQSVATSAVTWQKRGKLHGVQPQSLWARGIPSGELITIVWFQTHLPNFLGTNYSPMKLLTCSKKKDFYKLPKPDCMCLLRYALLKTTYDNSQKASLIDFWKKCITGWTLIWKCVKKKTTERTKFFTLIKIWEVLWSKDNQ